MLQVPIPSPLPWVGIPAAIAVLASTVTSFTAGPWWIVAWLLGAMFLVGWAIVPLASAVHAALHENWKNGLVTLRVRLHIFMLLPRS
jgi:hypothetical protein